MFLAGLALLCGAVIWFGDEQNVIAQEGKKAKAEGALRAIPGAGQMLDAAALAKIIDAQIALKLAEHKVKSSPVSDDSEFIRRVYLDIIGVIPPGDKVAAFLDNKDPNKRAKLVDELLEHPRYATHQAEQWVELLLPRNSNNLRPQIAVAGLHDWLAARFRESVPWTKIAYDLVTAAGDQAENGAVTYFVSNNTVDKMTGSVTKLFLGVQLQCAQCHNHPFTNYKQDDFWATAQFFSRVKAADPKKAAKNGDPVTVTEVAAAKAGKFAGKKGKAPDGFRTVPAKFLQQSEKPQLTGSEPYRPVFAKWMISANNPYFGRAFVNRTWHHFMGRGFINPIDDMHGDNPATHPELLAALTEQFKANNFDVKYLIRAIVLSETYQRTSRPAHGNETDAELYSHATVRVLTPFQLYDSLTSIVGAGGPGKGAGIKGKPKDKAAKKGVAGGREGFVAFFLSENSDPTEYEAGIPQALRLMNSPMLNNTGPTVTEAMRGASSSHLVIERLFLTALARRPTEAESTRFVKFVNRPGGGGAQQAYGDILWVLLNTSEFTLNH